jgi:hypothetical protein
MNEDEPREESSDGAVERTERRPIPAVWPDQFDEARPIFANLVMSQFTQNDFFLTFGLVMPPTAPQSSATSAPVQVLVRIAMSPGTYRDLRRVLDLNYSRWLERFGSQELDEDEDEDEEVS